MISAQKELLAEMEAEYRSDMKNFKSTIFLIVY